MRLSFPPGPPLLAATLFSVLSMTLPVQSQTQTQTQTRAARPVVALECRAAEAHLPGACRALKDALRDRMPGAVQRVMDDLGGAPARPGDLALALRVSDGRVRLDWRHGADALREGPSAPLAGPADALVGRLLDDLPDPPR